MQTYFFDTSIYNNIIDTSGCLSHLTKMKKAGSLRIYSTYEVERQLRRTPRRIRRLRLICCFKKTTDMVPATIFRLDITRLGQGRLNDGLIVEAIQGNSNDREDAVIGATSPDCDYFATADKKLAKRVCREVQHVIVIDFDDLLNLINFVPKSGLQICM